MRQSVTDSLYALWCYMLAGRVTDNKVTENLC